MQGTNKSGSWGSGSDSNLIMESYSGPPNAKERKLNRLLLVLNCTMMALGGIGGPLIMRLYFLKGGKGVWTSSALETAGWPMVLITLVVSYVYRRDKEGPEAKMILITPRLLLPCAVLGVLTGLDDYLYAYGVDRLPTSTSSLIIATQLAFTAGFAFVLVRQKFTPFSINAVFLLTVGAVVLGMHTSTDRPNNESSKEYFKGFFTTLGASALYGFVLPAFELNCKKASQNVTYTLVMEMQMVMSFFATVFCGAGMLVHKEFAAIPIDASEFELGEAKFYVVLVFNAILWQFFFMGAIGVTSCASSLLSGIMIAVSLPVTEILSVVFFHDKFKSEKAISLVLSLWGLAYYFYGEARQEKKNKSKSKQQEGLGEEEVVLQLQGANAA